MQKCAGTHAALAVGGTGLAFFAFPSGLAWMGVSMPKDVVEGIVIVGLILLFLCPTLYALTKSRSRSC